MLLAVAGMVGTGKSTLTKALAERFGLRLALESVDDDNPWLEPYYGEPDGMRRYALPLQLHFLATRFASLRRMRARKGGWLLDRTWYEDAEIFARGLHERGDMSAPEYDLYCRLYEEMLHLPAAKPPKLLIYLHAPLDEIVRRIGRRGRPKESETDIAYWADLHGRYAEWCRTFKRCPMLPVDVRDYDLLADPNSLDPLVRTIRSRIEKAGLQHDIFD